LRTLRWHLYKSGVDLNCEHALVLIEHARSHSRPVFVAVDGRSGAGKSTFATALAAASGATIIEGDDFYAGGIEVRGDTAKQRADACIDRPKLCGVLQQLASGKTATYRPFDWEVFDGSLRGPAITVQSSSVIIVEGVYSGHPDLRGLMHVKILLTAPDTVRTHRLLEREGSIGPWERQWHEAEEWYFSHNSVTTHFDLIIE
jgi:uridine kinase